MAHSGDYSVTGHIPTFSFTLPTLTNTEDIPNLFNSP